MSGLTTHVLDTVAGEGAVGLRVELFRREGETFVPVRAGITGEKGRLELLDAAGLRVGGYRLVFHVGEYFARRGVALADPPFLDQVPVEFGVASPAEHYHVPLLVAPWSYSTYRGS